MIFLFLLFPLVLTAKLKPKKCPKPLVPISCGSERPRKCSDGPNPPVPLICVKNACGCKKNYVFHKNKCIPYSKCPKKCGKNEIFKKCGTACPKKCSDDPKKSKHCIFKCIVNTCQCKPGYVLDDNNKCIRKKDCPKKCGKNEELKQCGTACPEKCSDDPKKPKVCTLQCLVNVCQCKPGYVLDDNNKCIPKEDCPKKCGENEILEQCGTACPEKCSDDPNKPKPCTKQCIVNECQCKPGYVLDDNNKCILRENCPKKCGENEEFTNCGSTCPERCSDDPKKSKVCNFQCLVNVCQCKPGYVLDDNNKCIRREDCPKKCGKNEELKKCGTACPEKCSDDPKKPKVCTLQCLVNECGSACIHRCSDGPIPPVCPFICIENVCRCEYPLIFHNNRCIPYSQCPKKCDRNSTFTNCDTACPLKCSDYPFKPKPCTKQCILNSCACKPGFVLNAFKKCIRKEDCPQWRRPPKKPKCKNRRKVFSTCPNHEENYCFPPVYRARNCGTPRCIYCRYAGI
uniref:Zonadhesin-like n=1 Tax=Strongyloides stercoralis TaxID=6248 RepID=A0A0K0EAF5_STRER